jgi:hypothetical protein
MPSSSQVAIRPIIRAGCISNGPMVASNERKLVGDRTGPVECPDHLSCRSRFGLWTTIALLSVALMHGVCAAQPGRAQTKKPSAAFRLLYGFTGGSDGYLPFGGLAFDSNGALYGTSFFGGTGSGSCQAGCGTVFQLLPTANGPWTQNTIHSFTGYPSDVSNSYAHVTFDSAGNLYGTAGDGGQNLCFTDSCGGIFELSLANGVWKESVIYNFNKHTGETPYSGVTLYKGVLYGTTWFGPETKNDVGSGTVFTLAEGNGAWKHKIIHSFVNGVDGYEPYADLVFDKKGNAYGSTPYGGTSYSGDIFKLVHNGNGWTETLLYSFPSNYVSGAYPSTLVFDSSGNLYGVTSSGGTTTGQDCRTYGCGTVFELKHGKTGWRQIILYEFAGGSDGYSPSAGLVFDNAGSLYGTTFLGGTGTCQFYQYPGCGTVFKLTRATDGKWHKTTLYNFAGGSDGEFPNDGNLILDDAGHLYGATLGGATYGSSGYGTVYQITP